MSGGARARAGGTCPSCGAAAEAGALYGRNGWFGLRWGAGGPSFAGTVALEVDRPHQVDLGELVGGPGLRPGVLLPWQQRGQSDPRCGQAVALQHALDGTFAGQRTDAQRLQPVAHGGRLTRPLVSLVAFLVRGVAGHAAGISLY